MLKSINPKELQWARISAMVERGEKREEEGREREQCLEDKGLDWSWRKGDVCLNRGKSGNTVVAPECYKKSLLMC